MIIWSDFKNFFWIGSGAPYFAWSNTVIAAVDDPAMQDLSRILGSMGIPHQNKIAAGPMVLDIHLHDMCSWDSSQSDHVTSSSS